MHIEKRVVGKARRYFLAHSYREGAQVHKFRKYLGQDLKQELLAERRIIAEKLILEEIHKYRIIRDPLQIALSEQELAAIRTLESKIPLTIRHLSEEAWTTFSKVFTYNTNAIEGSTLNRTEVDNLLGKDQWPNKSKEDIAEAFGVDEAITFIRTTNEHVSLDLIAMIHKIVFKNSKAFAGKIRKKGEEVVVMGGEGHVVHEGAPQPRINHLLKELVTWYDTNKNKYPGIILAAVVHNHFENIHPFRDGNGRVGRILLNNILIKHGLPPLSIDIKNRAAYYAALQAYEKDHDLKPTITLFLKEYASLRKTIGDHNTKKK
jgi:Fic family protein